MLIWGGTGITRDLAAHLEGIIFDHVAYRITSVSPTQSAFQLYANGQMTFSDLQVLRNDLRREASGPSPSGLVD